MKWAYSVFFKSGPTFSSPSQRDRPSPEKLFGSGFSDGKRGLADFATKSHWIFKLEVSFDLI